MSTHTDVTSHSHGGSSHGGAHAAEHEHGGPALYTKTLLALLVLTGITVGAAYIDLGSGNVVVALIIATIKASLVALFFMHLRWEKPVNAIIAVAGFRTASRDLPDVRSDRCGLAQLLSAAKRASHRNPPDAGNRAGEPDRDPA